MTDKKLVLGIGNPLRRDDGAGPAVLQRLAALGHGDAELLAEPGDGARIMELWDGYDRVWVADASRGGGQPGAIQRFDAATVLPARLLYSSSHLFGLAEAIETARALGRLPPQLVVSAIEAESFDHGEGLSPAVAVAVEQLAARIAAELDAA